MTPRRTTEPFTLHSVWLYHWSVTASTSAGTSTRPSAGNLTYKHTADDEFFFVLDGHFIVDLEERSIDLQPRQGIVVPKGVTHRTRAPERAVIIMVENATITPTGDA
jgi:mannose-6-phosphate isomerase-like protein (cupin superfamily)